MKVRVVDAARSLGVSPLQVLVELAAMNQPREDCWPECDGGFIETIRERRRQRMGLPVALASASARPSALRAESLPVSDGAAAILDKLLRKSYGLKSIRVYTLLHKWVHGASEDDSEELVQRGNLQWTEGPRAALVNLASGKLQDTEQIVELYRGRQGRH